MNNPRLKFGDIILGDLSRYHVLKSVDSNQLTEGPNVRAFEERLSKLFDYKHVILTSSGTMAGEVLTKAIVELTGVKYRPVVWPESGARPYPREIVTPACAFVSTANVILSAGLFPRFVDIKLDTLNMDPEKAEAAVNPQTIAIQFVAQMGKGEGLKEISDIAERKDRYLIIDCCEAHGGTLDGKDYGKYGDAAIYSFYPAHQIIMGEGGAICTDDDEIANMCRMVKNHGRPVGSDYFDFQVIGTNGKTTELSAAIGLEQLEKFHSTFERRRKVRQIMLDAVSQFDELITFPDGEGERISPHAFPVLLRDEDGDVGSPYEFMEGSLFTVLEESGVQTKSLFGALSNHRAFQYLNYPVGSFPVSEAVGRRGLHWGAHEGIDERAIEYLVEVLRGYFGD